MDRKQIISKDVVNADKVMENFHDNPAEAIKELTRIMVENIQRQQLNDLDVNWGMDICSQLKASSNNIFGAWAMKSTKPKQLKQK